MKSLRDYLAESEQWMNTPAEGDVFAIELPDEVLCETYIIEVANDCILLDSTAEINAALQEFAVLEDTDAGESGIVMETMGYGTLVGEGAMKHEMMQNAERMSLAQFQELYGDEDWIEDFWRVTNDEPEVLKEPGADPIAPSKDSDWTPERRAAAAKKGDWSMEEDQSAGVVAQKELDIDAAQRLATDEAKYQGREVPLGTPMQGDVKKFKVYVRDPKTGNVKKVNFGDKTMRIKKSNPARRKSFRARHNCANPGPRTKARYWSCRKW